jgi:hypothetical protein
MKAEPGSGFERLNQAREQRRERSRQRNGNEAQGKGEAPPGLTTTAWWRDPETIPRRQFLYERHYIRSVVTATIAAGGRAKTTGATYEALSMATGRDPMTGDRCRPVLCASAYSTAKKIRTN